MYLFVTSLIMFALGLAGWRAGRRGTRVDDHILCGACRYDMTGLPAGGACPECGERTLRTVGNRRPNPVLKLVGATLLFAAAMVLTVATMLWYRGEQVTAWKPYAMLRWESLEGSEPSQAVAAWEIRSRLMAGRLSRSDIEPLVENILARQADHAGPWSRPWGQIVESAHTTGKLSPVLWDRYLFQSRHATLKLSAQAVLGQPVSWELVFDDRGGTSWPEGLSGVTRVGYRCGKASRTPRILSNLDKGPTPAGTWAGEFDEPELISEIRAGTKTLETAIELEALFGSDPPAGKHTIKQTFEITAAHQ